MRIALIFIIYLSSTAYADSVKDQPKETKKFQTMKSCVSWLDDNFKNSSWHKEGYAWDLLVDTPIEVVGATFLPSKEIKNKFHPVSFRCEFISTGTRGSFFQGSYQILSIK